jgi:hypothetical protein
VAAESGNTDFCIRTSGSAWGRPVFRDGGNDFLCQGNGTSSQPGGLSYGQSTIPFAVPAGKIDVKAIPAGSTCAAAATSELDGVAVPTKGAITLMRYAGGVSSPEKISALPEEASAAVGSTSVRVVNALSGGESINVGFASGATLPATITTQLFTTPIPPGADPSAQKTQVGPVDSFGYLQLIPQVFHLAASYSTDAANNAITLYGLPQNVDVATFYVLGDPKDTSNKHPVTGLYCEDTQSVFGSGTFDAGTVDAGGFDTQDAKLLAQCTFAPLSDLSIDMVNASLYGANAPFEDQRRSQLIADVAARTSDIICVVEADDLNLDRAALASAAKANNAQGGPGQFQYSYMVTTTGATPPSNPSDVPAVAPSTPPCGGIVPAGLVDNVYTCVEQKCSTVSGGDPNGTGILNGTTQCLSAECITPFGELYTYPLQYNEPPGSLRYQEDYCFDCTVYYFTSEETFATGKNDCTQNSAPPFAYDGQTPSMILSHYPLVNTSSYNFPSTGYRRAILKAQVQLENQTIDFFCGQLISPLIDSSLPYTGNYGSDALADGGQANGWEQEQDLQAQEGLKWIQAQIKADGLPAIVAMDLHSDDPGSSAAEDGGLAPISPEVFDLFSAAVTPASGLPALAPATVPGSPPGCDYCPAPENVYNAGTPPYEFMHAYLSGFPQNATEAETLWGNDNSEVTLTSGPDQPAPPGGTGPIFEYYAHNYTILRPQAQ